MYARTQYVVYKANVLEDTLIEDTLIKVHKYIHTYSISIEDENNTQITASFYL